jgi:hypothetical protein
MCDEVCVELINSCNSLRYMLLFYHNLFRLFLERLRFLGVRPLREKGCMFQDCKIVSNSSGFLVNVHT